jgi:hypothetical protein
VAIILTRQGRLGLTRSFRRDLVSANDYFYLAVGKTTAWDDEENPDTPVDSVYNLNEVKRNIIFVQNADSADICHLARRINWVSGTVYDAYDDSYGRSYVDVKGSADPLGSATYSAASGATSLADANFYVMTDEYKVYKCLDNNLGAASTVKPTSTGTSAFTLDDDYKWKFMFQISSSDQTKFLTTQYIPVRKFTTEPYGDVNGEIDSIAVTDGGSGYTSAPTVTIAGDGTGATATADPAKITAGVLDADAITVTNAGSGYSYARVTISGGGATTDGTATANVGDIDSLPALQAAVESTTVGGTIDKIEILDAGADYIPNNVKVVITGDGLGAEASATVDANTGQITKVDVTDAGVGYSFADITFTDLAGAENPADTKCLARSIVSPTDGHGAHPINELYANRIAIVVNLDDNLNSDLFLDNDFRQVSLIRNLKQYDSETVNYTANTGTNTHKIEVGSSTEHAKYTEDDIITTDDGGKFRVIQKKVDGSNYYVYLQPIIDIISAVSTLTNNNTSVTGLSINSYTAATDAPEINVFSGELVYVENRAKINRQEDQVETIKAIITF